MYNIVEHNIIILYNIVEHETIKYHDDVPPALLLEWRIKQLLIGI